MPKDKLIDEEILQSEISPSGIDEHLTGYLLKAKFPEWITTELNEHNICNT